MAEFENFATIDCDCSHAVAVFDSMLRYFDEDVVWELSAAELDGLNFRHLNFRDHCHEFEVVTAAEFADDLISADNDDDSFCNCTEKNLSFIKLIL